MRKNGTADNSFYGKRPRHNVPQIAAHDKFAEYPTMDSIAGHSAAAFIKGMQCYEDTKKRRELRCHVIHDEDTYSRYCRYSILCITVLVQYTVYYSVSTVYGIRYTVYGIMY